MCYQNNSAGERLKLFAEEMIGPVGVYSWEGEASSPWLKPSACLFQEEGQRMLGRGWGMQGSQVWLITVCKYFLQCLLFQTPDIALPSWWEGEQRGTGHSWEEAGV